MVGPVFEFEILRSIRRPGLHGARWLYALWLLGVVGCTALADKQQAFYSGSLFLNQIVILLLVVPPFTASALSEEKTRQTLQFMLTTDLHGGDIVVGKWLARVAQIGLITLPILPLLCVFGDLSPLALLAIVIVSLLFLGVLAALSLLASVWTTTTGGAILLGYGLAGAVCYTIQEFIPSLDPIEVLKPALGAGESLLTLKRLVLASAGWGALVVGCLAVASWRLRPSFKKQLERSSRPRSRWNFFTPTRPPVSDNPVRWREKYVEGIAPLAFLRRLPLRYGVACIFLLTVLGDGAILWQAREPGMTPLMLLRESWHAAGLNRSRTVTSLLLGAQFFSLGMMVLIVANVAIAVRAGSVVSTERERGTWEALLLTGLEKRELLLGALWGIFGAGLPYLLAHLLPALVLAVFGGPWALGAALFCLLVTGGSVAASAVVALERSTREMPTWKCVLHALVITGGFLFAMTWAMGQFAGCLIAIAATILGGWTAPFTLGGLALVLGLLLFLISRSHLRKAIDQFHAESQPAAERTSSRRAPVLRTVVDEEREERFKR